jgi:hypothetical protein
MYRLPLRLLVAVLISPGAIILTPGIFFSSFTTKAAVWVRVVCSEPRGFDIEIVK